MKYDSFSSGVECYQKFGANYPLIVSDNIEGDTINSLEEWYNHPYKYEIMADAMKFKQYLRTFKIIKPKWWYPSEQYLIGRIGMGVNTPIGDGLYVDSINEVIDHYESKNGDQRLIDELKNVKTYGKNVFCHNYLCYKSFVIKDNKLIGIKIGDIQGFIRLNLKILFIDI